MLGGRKAPIAAPLSPAELRLDARRRWREKNSRYSGVIGVARTQSWAAQVLFGGGKQATVRCGEDEEEAALVHHRMAVFLSGA